MCCGFGGALLLFLITSAAAPLPSTDNQVAVIRCRHVSGPRAEIGLEYIPPGASDWVRPAQSLRAGGDVTISARSHPASGAESVIILPKPAPGRLKIRPYLVDFPAPHASPMGGTATASRYLEVTIDALGRRVALADDSSRSSRLIHPDDTGNTITVVVTPGGIRAR